MPAALAPAALPTLAEVMNRATQLQQAGQGEAAAAVYEDWLSRTDGPLRHVASFNLGTVLSTLGRDDAAEAAYRDALACQTDFAPALLNLGHLLERRGHKDTALAEWQRGDRRRPGTAA